MELINTNLDRNLENKIYSAQTTISGIITEKRELTTEVNGLASLPQVTIRDREYIETKTKAMITRCENMMEQLEESFKPTVDDEGKIKNNFSLYGVDVYAKLVNVVASQIRELRELNKLALGMDVVNAESMLKKIEEDSDKKSKNIKLSSSDLLKLIREAGESNQLHAVDAEFKVVNKDQIKETVNG